MPFAAAGAIATVAAAGVGAYEDGQNRSAQKSAIAPTQAAQGTLYADAENIASTPYQAYTGQETAPLSANQQYAVQKAASDPTNDGSAADFAKAGGQADYIAGNQWNAATASKFMNPYTQSVTNAALGVEQRNYQDTINKQNATAAQSGAFGGDRAALTNAATTGENELAQGTTEAQGNAAAYSNAQAAWEADNQRAGAAGALYDANGNAIVSQSNAEIANLDATGGVVQQTQQAKDSAGYNDYLDQRNYAANQLAPLEAAVGKNVYANPAPTNTASALLGAGAAAVGAYGKSQTPNGSPGYTLGDPSIDTSSAGQNINIGDSGYADNFDATHGADFGMQAGADSGGDASSYFGSQGSSDYGMDNMPVDIGGGP